MRALRSLLLAAVVALAAACDGPEGHWRDVPTSVTDPERVLRTLPSDLTNEPTPDQVLLAFVAFLWVPYGLALVVSLARWRSAARDLAAHPAPAPLPDDARERVLRHRTSAGLAAAALVGSPLLLFPDWTLLAAAGRVVEGTVVATAQWTTSGKGRRFGHDAVRVETGAGTFEFHASRALSNCNRVGGCRAVPVLVAPGGVTAALGTRPAMGGIRLVVLASVAAWGALMVFLGKDAGARRGWRRSS